MPQNQSDRPPHVGGCPCEDCEAERAMFEQCRAVLIAAGEVRPDIGEDR